MRCGMQDKFNLTLEENIFLAKKALVQNIYNEARLEGINITFPQTQTIIDGVSVGGLPIDEVEKVLNLRDAWRFVLKTVEEPATVEYMNQVNGFVARNEALEWGKLRTGTVGISGTDYEPPIPAYENVKTGIENILDDQSMSDTEKGLTLFLTGCRNQYYWDGNKRTSAIFANKYLISKGKGVMSVPDKDLLEFNTLLTDYYSTDDMTKIKPFLYDKALVGMERQRSVTANLDNLKQAVKEQPTKPKNEKSEQDR